MQARSEIACMALGNKLSKLAVDFSQMQRVLQMAG
jgi:hypothetical protein